MDGIKVIGFSAHNGSNTTRFQHAITEEEERHFRDVMRTITLGVGEERITLPEDLFWRLIGSLEAITGRIRT